MGGHSSEVGKATCQCRLGGRVKGTPVRFLIVVETGQRDFSLT
jgi:hypothetical protein